VINLLKLIQNFPNLKVPEIANFTEKKAKTIETFLKALGTKNKKTIQQTLNTLFLDKIKSTNI